MSGIVKAPVVTALAIALPLTVPNSPLEITATFPAPPRVPPATARAPSVKKREQAAVGHDAAEEHEQEDERGRDQRGDAEDPLGGQHLQIDAA